MLTEIILIALQSQARKSPVNLLTSSIVDGELIGGELGDIAIFQIHESVRYGFQSEGIGPRKMLANTHTQHKRTALTCHDNRIRFLPVNDGQGIGAFQLPNRFYDCGE